MSPSQQLPPCFCPSLSPLWSVLAFSLNFSFSSAPVFASAPPPCCLRMTSLWLCEAHTVHLCGFIWMGGLVWSILMVRLLFSWGRSMNIRRMKAPVVCLCRQRDDFPLCHLLAPTVSSIPMTVYIFCHACIVVTYLQWWQNWVKLTLRRREWWESLKALWSSCFPLLQPHCFPLFFPFTTAPSKKAPLSVYLLPHPPHLHPSLQPSATASEIPIYWAQWSAALLPLRPSLDLEWPSSSRTPGIKIWTFPSTATCLLNAQSLGVLF